ncbi:MAG: alpha/beta hydrolase [Acidobacteria bacterium]|nr:alpha/beta hydrolase [Acidobacteriota bacterium]
MIWCVLTLMAYVAIVSIVALLPIRRIPALEMISWVIGWLTGELVVVSLALEVIVLGVMVQWGWPTDWRAEALTALAVLAGVTQLILLGAMWRSRGAVARGVRTSGPFSLEDYVPHRLRYNSWWRSLLVVPLRSRDIAVTRSISYGPHQLQRLDVLRTSLTPQNAPVLLYIHGGAWVFGDKREQARPMMFEFVRHGWVVVSINYRLAPFDIWPAQIHDVNAAIAWTKKHIAIYGGDPTRVVLAGGSAGGQLCALAATTSNVGDFRPPSLADDVDLSVRGAIPFYGVHDMTGDDVVWRGTGQGLRHLLETAVMKQSIVDNPDLFGAASPLRRVACDAPPFLIVQGRNDSLVDRNVATCFLGATRHETPAWLIELPLAQHAFDLSHSARTSASTRAALAFATWCVAQPIEPYPAIPETLLSSYAASPRSLRLDDVPHDDIREIARKRGAFVVIVPSDPWSHAPNDATRNRELTQSLRLDLVSRGSDFAPVTVVGGSPDHEERSGFAVWGLSGAAAQRLARRYHQFVYYDVSADALTVCTARDGEILTALPV